jgi:hypothetical protein
MCLKLLIFQIFTLGIMIAIYIFAKGIEGLNKQSNEEE